MDQCEKGCSLASSMGTLRGLLGKTLLVSLILLAGAVPLQALDPQRSLHQYGHDRWNQQDGLPGSAVRGVYQLSDGYIWLHSGGNLFRFDGVRFVQIKPEVGGVATGESILAASLGSDRRLLLRGKTRTLRLDGGTFTDAAPATVLPDGMDMAVCEARDGSVWVASDNQIYRMKHGKLDRIVQGASWTHQIIEDRQGSIWIASISGLYRSRNERITKFPPGYKWSIETIEMPQETPTASESAIKLPKDPSALMEDKSGCLWIGTILGLFKLKDGVMMPAAELRDSFITALMEDRDGNIWVGTQGQGLFRISKNQCTNLTTRDGLSDDNIVSLGEDREGSLWIGTRTGLDRLRNTPLLTLTTKEGLSNDNTCNVLEGRDGTLYVATIGGGITRIKDGRSSITSTRNGLPKDATGNFYEAKDGAVWAGMDHGVAEFRNGQFKAHTAGGRLASVYTSAICEDDQSLILACSDLNLYRYQNGQLTPYNLKLATSTGTGGIRYVFNIHRDEEGTLWFAMTAGLYRLARHEPPEKAVLTAFREPAQTLYDDGRGFLWITSRNVPGFTRLRKSDGSLVHYTPECGITMDAIGRILTDNRGHLWVASSEGIFTFSRDEVDAFAEGRIKQIQPIRFGTIDGLKTEDCGVLSPQPSSWRSQSGKLYFSSRKGLVLIDPDRQLRNPLKPTIHIESILVDGEVQKMGAPLRFEAGKEHFEIQYTALSLLVPSRVKFKYRLVGFDSDWVDVGTRRTAFYTRIPPGTYKFQVKACNNDGLWNEEGSTLDFTLRPHVYQTFWFYGLIFLGTAGAIIGAFILRARQHRLAEQELQRRITEALAHIKTLHGLLPICAWCHKIRDDKGYWSQIEDYLGTHTQAEFSHGICPECREKVSQQGKE
jgi:ligand-binding sensor domain-containing protein